MRTTTSTTTTDAPATNATTATTGTTATSTIASTGLWHFSTRTSTGTNEPTPFLCAWVWTVVGVKQELGTCHFSVSFSSFFLSQPLQAFILRLRIYASFQCGVQMANGC